MGVALAVTAGAVTAISARQDRSALVGLAIALGFSPFLGDPLPQVSTLAARVVGAALIAYLLRSAVDTARPLPAARQRVPGGSRIGWPTEALIAAAAWIVAVVIANGLAALAPNGSPTIASDVVGMLTPGAVTAAAGLASMVVAVVPAFGGRDAPRTTIGSLVLTQGVLLFRVGVAGPPSDLEQLGGVMLLLAIGVAGAWLIGAEARRDQGDGDGGGAGTNAGPGDELADARGSSVR